MEKVAFELSNATNRFGDEFTVIHVAVDVERYTRFEEAKAQPDYANAFTQIATTVSEIGPYVRFIAVYLEEDDAPAPVPTPSLLISSASVEQALHDATLLIRSAGAPSAVDRVHTALHGYLRGACERAGIDFPVDASLAALFKLLRVQHPAMAVHGSRAEDIRKVGNSVGAILDALGPIRNHASMAHPTDEMLEEEEAMLLINTARTILHYLDAKLK